MAKHVDFGFEQGEKVNITAINTPGHVDALMLDNTGKAYRVVYWMNGERRQTWMYEWEINHEHY